MEPWGAGCAGRTAGRSAALDARAFQCITFAAPINGAKERTRHRLCLAHTMRVAIEIKLRRSQTATTEADRWRRNCPGTRLKPCGHHGGSNILRRNRAIWIFWKKQRGRVMTPRIL